MPLEPIEDKDLDVRNKFIEQKPEGHVVVEKKEAEASFADEKRVERIEGAVEKDDAYSKIVSKIKTTSPQVDPAHIQNDARSAAEGMDAESRIKNLVDIAMQKGVAHAVNVARHIDDNYVLDEFHDKLMAEELHNALVEKGLIKDV